MTREKQKKDTEKTKNDTGKKKNDTEKSDTGKSDTGKSDKKNDKMFEECVLGVRAHVFTTNELKGKCYHEEQSSLSTTGGHRERAVVNVHVVNSER